MYCICGCKRTAKSYLQVQSKTEAVKGSSRQTQKENPKMTFALNVTSFFVGKKMIQIEQLKYSYCFMLITIFSWVVTPVFIFALDMKSVQHKLFSGQVAYIAACMYITVYTHTWHPNTHTLAKFSQDKFCPQQRRGGHLIQSYIYIIAWDGIAVWVYFVWAQLQCCSSSEAVDTLCMGAAVVLQQQ